MQEPKLFPVKRLAPVAVSVLLLCSAAVASPAAQTRTIKRYCSPTGDICYGAFAANGSAYFKLTTAALYFQRYRLC